MGSANSPFPLFADQTNRDDVGGSGDVGFIKPYGKNISLVDAVGMMQNTFCNVLCISLPQAFW